MTNKLSKTQFKYLICIAKLQEKTEKVKCKEIADILEISKPSVHRMIVNLSELGIVEKPLYGKVTVTSFGKELIDENIKPYNLLFNYFISKFTITEIEAEKIAFTLTCELSNKSINEISRKIINFKK